MDLPANELDTIIRCERCDARCKVDGPRNSKARMLRRSKEPKGLCINCAVHNWLRNTYPPNVLLVQLGPKILRYPHIQKQFTEIMRVGFADAKPDEINWNLIIENWDLPFPHKVKTSATNPCSQRELDDITARKHPGLGHTSLPKPDPLGGKTTITSFEEVNLLEPGLGDKFRIRNEDIF